MAESPSPKGALPYSLSTRVRICKSRCAPLCALRGCHARHILPLLAMRNTKHGSWLGRWRWVVERTFAWLYQFRRLRVRYERRADIHEAFLLLACAVICWHHLRSRFG